jgi:hypothetical protein
LELQGAGAERPLVLISNRIREIAGRDRVIADRA